MDNNEISYSSITSELDNSLTNLKETLFNARNNLVHNLVTTITPAIDSINHSLVDQVKHLPTYTVMYSVNFRKLGRKLLFIFKNYFCNDITNGTGYKCYNNYFHIDNSYIYYYNVLVVGAFAPTTSTLLVSELVKVEFRREDL